MHHKIRNRSKCFGPSKREQNIGHFRNLLARLDDSQKELLRKQLEKEVQQQQEKRAKYSIDDKRLRTTPRQDLKAYNELTAEDKLEIMNGTFGVRFSSPFMFQMGNQIIP